MHLVFFFYSFRAKLAEANAKITQLYAEVDRMGHDRKSTFQHDKQLEELRNIQVKRPKTKLCEFCEVAELKA